jgi:hypothetical protein
LCKIKDAPRGQRRQGLPSLPDLRRRLRGLGRCAGLANCRAGAGITETVAPMPSVQGAGPFFRSRLTPVAARLRCARDRIGQSPAGNKRPPRLSPYGGGFLLSKYIPVMVCSVLILGTAASPARAQGDPLYGSCAPAPVVAGPAPCESCARPGLFARIRERRQARACARTTASPCPSECCPAPRPGLFQRIRNRVNQRRGYFVPACP